MSVAPPLAPSAPEALDPTTLAFGPGPLAGNDQGTITREPLWYTWATGQTPHWPWRHQPDLDTDHAPIPETPLTQQLRSPGETVSIASLDLPRRDDVVFARQGEWKDPTEEGLVALAYDMMREVRADPEDPFNNHRGYASARCIFPVVAAVTFRGTWWVLDPRARTLIDTQVQTDGLGIALTGTPTAMPKIYRWFRASLVTLEVGIVSRHLAVLAAHHGIRLRVSGTPVEGAPTGVESAWKYPQRWSRPLIATSTDGESQINAAAIRPGKTAIQLDQSHAADDDPSLTAAYALINQTEWYPGEHELGTGVATMLEDPDITLDNVLFRRSAGRMPARRYGFRFADRAISAFAADDIISWMSLPAPSTLRAPIRIRFFRNAIEDREEDLFRIELHDDGTTSVMHLPAQHPAGLASAYGYPSGPTSSQDVQRTAMFCLITGQPRQTLHRHGPTAWNRLLATAGWAVHGGALAAAKHNLVARPVRAFDEQRLQEAAGLDNDEMPLLALLVGTPQPHGFPQIALPR